MRLALLACLLAVPFACAGCGDHGGGSDAAAPADGAVADQSAATHDAAPADAGPPDASPADASKADAALADAAPADMASIAVGMACPTGSECPAGYFCLGQSLGHSLPEHGYCTKQCSSDTDCGAGAFCGPPFLDGKHYCWADCDANQQCAGAHRVCSRHLDGAIDLARTACIPGDPAAVDGDPCASFEDCSGAQACFANPFENPGGVCATLGCTVGDDTTCAPGGNGRCVQLGAGTVCVAGCSQNSDCRQAEGYFCSGPNPPHLCVYPHATIGDPCAADGDCGIAGSPWRCRTDASFTGGYCTGLACDPGDDRTCPSNAHCDDPTPAMPKSGDEFCVKDCQSSTDCRSGYTCQAYDSARPSLMGCLPQ